MRPLEAKLLKGCGCLASLFVLFAILFPLFAQPGHMVSPENLCRRRLRQVATGLMLYLSDSDDCFPARDAWVDVSSRYVKDEGPFHCPSVPKAAYGYAFNAALSRSHADKLDEPAGTPWSMTPVNPIRNASDLVASLPSPGRHHGDDMIGYADGHVKTKRFGVAP